MGVVYRAVDPAIGRTVAIKMLKGGYAEDRDLLQRFYREARSTGSLQHRNIVTVFALGDLDGVPYLVMEYLEGEPVSEIISSRRATSLVEKLELIVQVCDGLHYAHCRNLIHRDIKSANVIVLPDGTSKIVDFGIARPTASQGLTQTGQVIGSPSYMSPEQINSEPLDARTDVFSTGVVLYELLTYNLPFKGSDTAATFMKILSGDPPPLSKYLEDYPPELDEIVSRALAKRLDDRYQSAEELGFDLLQVQRELQQGMTKSYLQVAENCLGRGDFERARLQLQEVLKLDRQNQGANRLLRQVRQAQQQQQRKSQVAQMRSQAEVALAGLQYEEALACAEQACRLDPSDIDSERLRDEIRKTIERLQILRGLLSRAESAMYAGELEDAKRSADEALRVVPDDSQAKALASAVEKELAARSRRAAIQSFVDNARQEISARNFGNAIDNLLHAEKLDPGDSNVAELLRWANRGQEQEERRRALQEVMTHIDEALRTEDFVSACTICDMGLAQFPTAPSLLKLKALAERQREVAKRRHFVQEESVAARTLAESGQHEAALRLVDEALRRYPDEPNLETLRALIGGELDMLTRDRLERERQLAAEESARQLSAEMQQRVLNAAARLRGCLDEQQDFATAANIASELQQLLSSEVMDQKTRDIGNSLLTEFQSRASAREQANIELERLIEAAEDVNPVLRTQAGERALAIQAAYPNDLQIQAAYASVTANLERWSQRRGKAIAELARIAGSMAQLPFLQAEQTRDRAEQIGSPFASDPQVGSLLQQIRNECVKRVRDRQRLLETLESFKVRLSQTRSLAEVNEVLDQAQSLVISLQSDSEISSTFSSLKTVVEDHRRGMEALVNQIQEIGEQIEQAATVELAENLLKKGNELAADNPENLDVQEMLTRIAGRVRGRRAEHDLIVHELTSLYASVSQTTLGEDLALIRQRSVECRAKHQRDPEITALCDQIESEAGRRQFVQEQGAAAKNLDAAGPLADSLPLLPLEQPEQPTHRDERGLVTPLASHPDTSSLLKRIPSESQQAINETSSTSPMKETKSVDESQAELIVPSDSSTTRLWPSSVLSQIERQLAIHIGPLARVIVRRAASRASNCDELFSLAAESLDTDAERQEFLACKEGLNLSSAEANEPARPQTTLPSARRNAQAQNDFDPALIVQATRLLSRYVGPIADLLVREAAQRTNSLETLYLLLADEVEDESERAQFLHEIDNLGK